MSRLFVDVDDTLIEWSDPEPIATEWSPNLDVVEFIKDWLKGHPDGEVIVWSSGGEDYARLFGQRVIPDIPHTAEAKYMLIPLPDDLCLDDAPFMSFQEATLHPKHIKDLLCALQAHGLGGCL